MHIVAQSSNEQVMHMQQEAANAKVSMSTMGMKALHPSCQPLDFEELKLLGSL